MTFQMDVILKIEGKDCDTFILSLYVETMGFNTYQSFG
jgi:hypothetical protein